MKTLQYWVGQKVCLGFSVTAYQRNFMAKPMGGVCVCVCVCVLVAQSCPTLYNFIDCGPPGSSVHGILQVRILE